MLIAFDQNKSSAHGGIVSSTMKLDENKQAKLYAILSDNLYKNPKMSMVRELSSNAQDSHAQANKLDVPFSMTLPTYENPVFIIRDFGVGLTADEAEDTILSFLASNKDHSDDMIGGYGLGSKSPFSYAEQYEVKVYKDGKYAVFNCWKDELGMPKKGLYESGDTSEENGVEMTIPIKLEDVGTFNGVCYQYLNDTDFRINVKNASPAYYHPTEIKHRIHINGFDFSVTNKRGKGIKVIYGGFSYDIGGIEGLDDGLMKEMTKDLKYQLLLHVGVGKCDFAVSREEIKSTSRTVNFISAALHELDLFIERETEKAITVMDSLLDGIKEDTPVNVNIYNRIYGEIGDSNIILDILKTSKIQSKRRLSVSIPVSEEVPIYEIGTIGMRKAPYSRCENVIKPRNNSIELSRIEIKRNVSDELIPLWYNRIVTKSELKVRRMIGFRKMLLVVADDESAAKAIYSQLGIATDEITNLSSEFEVKDKKEKEKKERGPTPSKIKCQLSGSWEDYGEYYHYVYVSPSDSLILAQDSARHKAFRLLVKYSAGSSIPSHKLKIVGVSENFCKKNLKHLDNFVEWKDVVNAQGIAKAYKSRQNSVVKALVMRHIRGDNNQLRKAEKLGVVEKEEAQLIRSLWLDKNYTGSDGIDGEDFSDFNFLLAEFFTGTKAPTSIMLETCKIGDCLTRIKEEFGKPFWLLVTYYDGCDIELINKLRKTHDEHERSKISNQ